MTSSGAWTVLAAVPVPPGFGAHQLEAWVEEDGAVVVRGRRQVTSHAAGDAAMCHVREFQRRYILPKYVDVKSISVQFEDYKLFLKGLRNSTGVRVS